LVVRRAAIRSQVASTCHSLAFTHDKTGNILSVKRAGLTNTPALEMAAICAVQDDETGNNPGLLASLIKALNLLEDATSDQIVTALLSRMTAPAQAQAAAMQSGRLPPAPKESGTALCKSDPQAFATFLGGGPFNLSGELLTGRPPGSDTTTAASVDPAVAICTQLGLPSGSL